MMTAVSEQQQPLSDTRHLQAFAIRGIQTLVTSAEAILEKIHAIDSEKSQAQIMMFLITKRLHLLYLDHQSAATLGAAHGFIESFQSVTPMLEP